MNYPMITWCIIASVLLCAFIYYTARHRSYSCDHKAKHLLRFGRETDMFYVPGDDKIPGIADNEDESEGQ